MKILLDADDMIFAQKPAGVLSEQCADGDDAVTQLSRLTGGAIYPVHRLDRAVGGVMVFAKTQDASRRLSAPGAVEKDYIAVVHGEALPCGEMRDFLFKDSGKNKSYVVKKLRRGVREAALSYETASVKDGMSLVRIKLETGRSHQIRVQFASRCHPLVGDGKYGASDGCPVALFSRSVAAHDGSGNTIAASATPDDVFPWNVFDLSVFDDI